MKKFTTILVLLFVLSVSAFAEGEIPASGKNCPQGQVCFSEGEIPTVGKNCPQGQTCFTDEGEIPASGRTENPIYQNIFDFLKSIFE